MSVEIIGIVATVIILVSMAFNTTTLKGDIIMRVTNLVGSLIFTVYGILLPAISTAVLNSALVFVNIYHLIILTKEKKKQDKKESNE